jgi:hypothetical protein
MATFSRASQVAGVLDGLVTVSAMENKAKAELVVLFPGRIMARRSSKFLLVSVSSPRL